MPTFTPHANRGKALEQVVLAAQQDAQGKVLCLHRVEQAARWRRGKRPGEAAAPMAVCGPCDFFGCVVGPAPAPLVVFDAKECKEPHGFPIGNPNNLKPHQAEFLIRMGQAGAIAGLLVEAKAIRRYLWLRWELLKANVGTFRWEWDHTWVDLGDTLHIPRLRAIPGVGEAIEMARTGRKGL